MNFFFCTTVLTVVLATTTTSFSGAEGLADAAPPASPTPSTVPPHEAWAPDLSGLGLGPNPLPFAADLPPPGTPSEGVSTPPPSPPRTPAPRPSTGHCALATRTLLQLQRQACADPSLPLLQKLCSLPLRHCALCNRYSEDRSSISGTADSVATHTPAALNGQSIATSETIHPPAAPSSAPPSSKPGAPDPPRFAPSPSRVPDRAASASKVHNQVSKDPAPRNQSPKGLSSLSTLQGATGANPWQLRSVDHAVDTAASATPAPATSTTNIFRSGHRHGQPLATIDARHHSPHGQTRADSSAPEHHHFTRHNVEDQDDSIAKQEHSADLRSAGTSQKRFDVNIDGSDARMMEPDGDESSGLRKVIEDAIPAVKSADSSPGAASSKSEPGAPPSLTTAVKMSGPLSRSGGAPKAHTVDTHRSKLATRASSVPSHPAPAFFGARVSSERNSRFTGRSSTRGFGISQDGYADARSMERMRQHGAAVPAMSADSAAAVAASSSMSASMIKQDVDGAFPTGELRRRKVRHSAETQAIYVNSESSPAPMLAPSPLPSMTTSLSPWTSAASVRVVPWQEDNGHSESAKARGQLPLSREGGRRLSSCNLPVSGSTSVHADCSLSGQIEVSGTLAVVGRPDLTVLTQASAGSRHFALTAGDALHLQGLILRGGRASTSSCSAPYTACGGDDSRVWSWRYGKPDVDVAQRVRGKHPMCVLRWSDSLGRSSGRDDEGLHHLWQHCGTSPALSFIVP